MSERYAIYYAPATTDPLWDRAVSWLGRDPATQELFHGPVAGIDRNRLLNLTQSASRYGFHATLKAPMALEPGTSVNALSAAMSAFAASHAPVVLGQLELRSLDGFLALVPAGPDEAIRDFAAKVVETFDPHRAPMTLKDRAARLKHGLTPRQEELLDGYGYPYVFEEYLFHMTLTDRLCEEDQADISKAAATWFAPVLDGTTTLDRLSLYAETDGGRPFARVADFQLQGQN